MEKALLTFQKRQRLTKNIVFIVMNPNLAPELPRLWQGPQDIPCQIARISYHMLKYKQEYQDPGRDFYEQQYRERVIKNLKRKAKALGME